METPKEFIEETKELLEFIKKSPTPFHAVKNIADMLKTEGAEELFENERWNLECGKAYFVKRNDTSVISFRLPESAESTEGTYGSETAIPKLKIIASHSDSPSFKIKEAPELKKSGHYLELNVEKYGGALLNPWFDRPLSIAGRVIADADGELQSILIDFDKDMVLIPSLAIHMNREANDGTKIDVQKTMMPLWGDESSEGAFNEALKEELKKQGLTNGEILGYDLYLYNRVEPSIWGEGEKFFSAGRIDDLLCAYESVKAFNETKATDSINVCVVFDNEEVGSATKQGADSTFLSDVIDRIAMCLKIDDEAKKILISKSFMVSADNAHALHPNFADKADPVNAPVLNGGVVIKYNAAQKYTTDAYSGAYFKKLCIENDVPYQIYTNNSNIAGGSTLGNISNTHVAMNTVDIGAPQLAMHSPYETAGTKDALHMLRAMKVFYE